MLVMITALVMVTLLISSIYFFMDGLITLLSRGWVKRGWQRLLIGLALLLVTALLGIVVAGMLGLASAGS